MSYKNALKDIKSKVEKDFFEAQNPNLHFHSIDHTKKVVSRANKIGKHYQLEDKQRFILLSAAWFHDTGYLSGKSQEHEARSAQNAEVYLKAGNYDENIIETVRNTILAAVPEKEQSDLLSQILLDADLYHLGTKSFFKYNKLLRREREWELSKQISKAEWMMQTIHFLTNHQFSTVYCRDKLLERKIKNLQKLKEKWSRTNAPDVKNAPELMAEKKN